ncbi:MAG: protocatechuate 3,4-dioxygenase subunit alpha [Candidatus Dormibacteraceae bacterium]
MKPNIPTPSQTIGPFFGFATPFSNDSSAVPEGEIGAMRIEGQLLDGSGEPVSDGLVEVWGEHQFARCRTDEEGAFHFTVTKPSSGHQAEGDAPHLDVIVFARGLLRHLVTRMYFPDEETANATDRVLAAIDPIRRETLIVKAEGDMLRFDIHLQGDSETVFFAL